MDLDALVANRWQERWPSSCLHTAAQHSRAHGSREDTIPSQPGALLREPTLRRPRSGVDGARDALRRTSGNAVCCRICHALGGALDRGETCGALHSHTDLSMLHALRLVVWATFVWQIQHVELATTLHCVPRTSMQMIGVKLRYDVRTTVSARGLKCNVSALACTRRRHKLHGEAFNMTTPCTQSREQRAGAQYLPQLSRLRLHNMQCLPRPWQGAHRIATEAPRRRLAHEYAACLMRAVRLAMRLDLFSACIAEAPALQVGGLSSSELGKPDRARVCSSCDGRGRVLCGVCKVAPAQRIDFASFSQPAAQEVQQKGRDVAHGAGDVPRGSQHSKMPYW